MQGALKASDAQICSSALAAKHHGAPMPWHALKEKPMKDIVDATAE